MTSLELSGPTQDELHDIFAASAKEGRKYLLIMADSYEGANHTQMNIHTRAIDSVSEILPSLRDSEKENFLTHATGLMDLSGDFARQSRQCEAQLDAALDPVTKEGLAAFYRAQNERIEKERRATCLWISTFSVPYP